MRNMTLRRMVWIVLVAVLWAAGLFGAMSTRASAQDEDEEEGKTHVLHEYTIHADLTYEERDTIDRQPVKPGRPAKNTSLWRDFSPATDTLEVAEAWVTDPDGSKHSVPPEDIFTRSAPQPANAPGFNANQRITVMFPRVGPNAKIHLVWKWQTKVPQMFGLNILRGALGSGKVDDETVVLRLPQTVPLKWYADPGVTTTDGVQDGQRVITASFKNIPAMKVGYSTVAYSEFRPRFMATTLDSLSDYGNRIFKLSERPLDAENTAKIKALAETITGDKTGLDAAAAIHDWIRQNIAYVAVDLNPNDGWVEHPVNKIIENGFGDCKDQSALMRALLAAKGIRAERAIVWWGNVFAALPLPVAWQFNHAILYLPDFDVFDNPTDKNAAFGALDMALSGKQAVLVEQQSKVVQLPAAKPQTFWSKNESVMKISPDGDIDGTAVVDVSPNSAMTFQSRIKNRGNDIYLSGILAMNNQEGDGKLHVSAPKSWRDPMRLKAQWTSQNYMDGTEPEIYLPLESGFDPERLTQLTNKIRNDVRAAPLLMGSWSDNWQFTYVLPEGFHVKYLPQAVHLANQAGRFDSEVTANGSQIIVKRSFLTSQTIYQPADYPALRALLVAAVKSGHSHAILQRSETAHL
ncbi:DUF3857 domain-containing protein [Rhizobium sp.]|jgi:hypothetical protein|uniref:DUF3857 domain-containing protein n=1 Tax=Rhizobium sp. TaxID=391 RepID=UPI002AA69CC1